MKKYFSSFRKGFTLIELLIVIAVLGILAAGVLIAVNPLEKIAQAKDSTKKTTVSQLANALQSYYALKATGTYPTASSEWIQSLVNNGDLKNVPPSADSSSPCETNNQSGYCYTVNSDQTEAAVFIPIESSSEKSQCLSGTAYFLWSSESGGSGLFCSAVGEPTETSGYTFGSDSTLTQSLVGWWKMDDNADDSSGNGNDGTIYGAIPTTDRNGNFNKAYSFDGTGDRIAISGVDFSANSGSVSIWFSLETAITGRIPLNDSHDNSAYIGVYPAGIIRLRTVTALSVDFTVPAISFNTWYHLVVTRSANKARVYLNGVESASGEQSFIGTFEIDQIGRYAVGQYPQVNWDGAIDDVRIYNRALSQAEITALHESN